MVHEGCCIRRREPRSLPNWERACRGELREWENAPESCLALIVLCDQVPRNLFRGDAKAFSTDPIARAAARHALDHGDDKALLLCSAGSCTCRSSTARTAKTSAHPWRCSSNSAMTRTAYPQSTTRTGTSRSSSVSAGSYIGTRCSAARRLRKKRHSSEHLVPRSAYRDWRGRLVLFDEIDVVTLVESEVDAVAIPT